MYVDEYVLQDEWNLRCFLDEKVGTQISSWIVDEIEKKIWEMERAQRELKEHSRYTDLMEECAGNLDTCIDKIEEKINRIDSILSSAAYNKKMQKGVYKSVMKEIDGIKEDINDVDEHRH